MPPYLHLRLPYHQRWKGQILPENKVSCESFGMDRKTLRLVNIRDQVRACDLIFESNKKWTIVPGNDFEVGVIQGMPFWCEQVGDPILESNLTRRIDFALFMVVAHKNDNLIHKVPAIVRCNTESATAYK
ncbi:hypothetical protein [Rhodohalobacter sulfatireducens]|nr:hypothetical protein [Rhodohalobacter sulfatireducens]